jgi:hypothetical protein
MLRSRKSFIIILDCFNYLLSEAFRHSVYCLKNELVPFLLEDVLFTDEELDEFEHKLLFRYAIGRNHRWIVEIYSATH